MSVITFISDFGWKDHYVASIKAKISAFNQNLKVIDITHEIEPNNIRHASYVLKNVYKDFPDGTVHLVAVNSWSEPEDSNLIALKMDNHYFVGFNNGIFSLLNPNMSSLVICELNSVKTNTGSFPEKNILALAAAQLASGANLYDLGKQLMNIKKLLFSLPYYKENCLVGQIVHIDRYGNAITNINDREINLEPKYYESTLQLGRHKVQFGIDFTSVAKGEMFAFFNNDHNLCIGIKSGDASKLLGATVGSEVKLIV
ncbi:MAG: SAM-dependent chlorinase/fluorinase [Cytophagales bacterium]